MYSFSCYVIISHSYSSLYTTLYIIHHICCNVRPLGLAPWTMLCCGPCGHALAPRTMLAMLFSALLCFSLSTMLRVSFSSGRDRACRHFLIFYFGPPLGKRPLFFVKRPFSQILKNISKLKFDIQYLKDILSISTYEILE